MARFSLVPRNEQFFDDFVRLAEEIRDGCTLAQADAVDRPAGHVRRRMTSRTPSTPAMG